ncbi:hypothetical protein BH10PSE12_BH10PSE12_18410 [soil metagenome]
MVGNRVYLRNLVMAALACLQPGIEPVFLNLLTAHAGLAPLQHGWVAGSGQLGMALGALLCWSVPAMTGRSVALGAGAIGCAATIAMLDAFQLEWIMAARTIMGFSAGILFTRATSAATRANANHAFGMILLIQLLLATAVSLALPLVALQTSPAFAIGLMALCPAAICLLLVAEREQGEREQGEWEQANRITSYSDERVAIAHRPLAVSVAAILAMFLFIVTTMMIWSYAGALGANMGLDDSSIGLAVAIGSFSGVLPALAAARMTVRVAPALTGLACGMAMLTLLAVPALDMGRAGFIGAMCFFNIGSTFAIIHFSALAVGSQAPAALRRCVAALHCTAMVVGPFAAGSAVELGGFPGLDLLATLALGVAVAALAFAAHHAPRPAPITSPRRNPMRASGHFSGAEIALD